MQVGRHKWRKGWTVAESNASDIAAIKVIFPMIHVVVTGVSGGRNRPDSQPCHAQNVAIFKDIDARLGHGRNLSPKPLHIVTEHASRRLDQLRRISQMRGAAWVHVDGGAAFREPPGCAGVIEVDMAE